eukprot:TRINITY_DN1831_c0_g2_i1.p1 TRINITY_DN1831_c0_g2~~TRINITY_DN1831_c0_g2_i1.p1  ORF type:complete len:540 (-),score=118.87 TRINITY_DN1831_c0_g2_i1:60-1679(-)
MTESTSLFLRHENRTAFSASRKRQLPVTIVTGFLGSGKTTLMNHILSNRQDLKIAAAVNDFAALNIDKDLISVGSSTDANNSSHQANPNDDGVIELTNGCVCCSLKDNLQDVLWKLLQFDERSSNGDIDYLLIETSGVTDPKDLISLMDRKYGKMTRIRLDSIVVVVDSDLLLSSLQPNDDSTSSPSLGVTFESQLKCADVVLLNKKDLLSEEGQAIVEKYVRVQAPLAQVHHCRYSKVGLPLLLDVQAVYSECAVIAREKPQAAYTLSATGGQHRTAAGTTKKTNSGDGTAVAHIDEDLFNSFTFESEKAFDLGGFQQALYKYFPVQVVRMKGMISFEEDSLFHGVHADGITTPSRRPRYVFHMSGRRRFDYSVVGSAVESTPGTRNQLIVIGRGLDEKKFRQRLDDILAPQSPADPLSALRRSDKVATAIRSIISGDHRFHCKSANETSALCSRCSRSGVAAGSEKVATPCRCDNVIIFRLVGPNRVAGREMTPRDISRTYGIEPNRMNDDLMRTVNNSGDCVFVTWYVVHGCADDE